MIALVEAVPVGTRLVDSLGFSLRGTRVQAQALRGAGVEGFIGYLGAMTEPRLDDVLATGMGFMPVTFAGEYDDGAKDEITQLRALGVPAGVTVWLDLEGMKAFRTPVVELATKINAWAVAILDGGWQPGLYVGAPQPFTSAELYALKVVRYWWGLGRCSDRHGQLAEPACGWSMIQQFHGERSGLLWRGTGILVDSNSSQKDYRGRAPTWMRRVT